MLTGESFLANIEAFLSRSGMTATAFGLGAVGDRNFVGDLRQGRKPSLRLVERCSDYIDGHRAKAARQAADAKL